MGETDTTMTTIFGWVGKCYPKPLSIKQRECLAHRPHIMAAAGGAGATTAATNASISALMAAESARPSFK